MIDEPRRIVIHRSLNRPHTLLGGERQLVLCAGLMSGLIAISGFTIFSVVCGVFFWVGSMWCLVKMGKVDPHLSEVYRRYLRYKSYYFAKAGGSAHYSSTKKWR